MTAILLWAALAIQDRPIDATVDAFLKGDDAARTELLKIGAPAIRPLLRARHRAFEKTDALLKEIKISVAYPRPVPLPGKFDGTTSMALILDTSADLNSMAPVFYRRQLPFFSDTFDNARLLSKRVEINNATRAMELVEELCLQTGLDYGYFHGVVVVGFPERLWPGPPAPKPPDLNEASLKRARELIRKLGDDDLENRASAGRSLVELGAGVIPLLEPHLGGSDKEVSARCEAILRLLRTPPESIFGPPACLLQKLTEGDRAFLRELQGIQPGGTYTRVPLIQIAADLKKTHGIEVVMSELASRTPVSIYAGNRTVVELLSLVTQSSNLDFILRDRKIVIDTYGALESHRK